MRIALPAAVAATLSVISAFGQGEDKSFYFTQSPSKAEMTAVSIAARTLLGLQDLSIDEPRHALVARGAVDKLVALDWLFHQVDRSPDAGPIEATVQYKFGDDVIAVVPVAPDATNPDITAVTTAIRTVVDLQRLFPLSDQNALLARGTPAQIAAADWIVHQLLPRDGETPTMDSPAYPSPIIDKRPDAEKQIIRILRMDPKATSLDLNSTINAVRTVADLQRLFPFYRGRAVIASGAPGRVAVAEWLVHEMAKAPDADAIHQITMPGAEDGVVRLFYVGKPVNVSPLVTQIGSTLQLNRVFPIPSRFAVVLRGRPDEVKIAGLLVANFADEAR